MDRRKSPRLEIQLAVRFQIQRYGDRLLLGKTLNMSRSGVLVEFSGDVDIQPGDLVEMEMDLAGASTVDRRCMFCVGTVVRVDFRPPHFCFATGIAEMHFRQSRVSHSLSRMGEAVTMVM